MNCCKKFISVRKAVSFETVFHIFLFQIFLFRIFLFHDIFISRLFHGILQCKLRSFLQNEIKNEDYTVHMLTIEPNGRLYI